METCSHPIPYPALPTDSYPLIPALPIPSLHPPIPLLPRGHPSPSLARCAAPLAVPAAGAVHLTRQIMDRTPATIVAATKAALVRPTVAGERDRTSEGLVSPRTRSGC